jgi:DNA-directed RNA polymerase subunit H (RpoH/RPB5)
MASAAATSTATLLASAPPRLRELMLSREAHLFLRSRNNLLEILETRGFDVSPLTAESPEEIEFLMENPLNFTYFVKEMPGDDAKDESELRRCKVFFANNVNQILSNLEDYHTGTGDDKLRQGKDEALIITLAELSETGIQATIKKSRELNLHIDAVSIHHLQFNPLKHELVPEYEVVPMNSELDRKIIETSAVRKRRQLPLIRRDDIIARVLGLRTDQLVIVRNRGPTGRHSFVRLCVE